MQVCERPSIKSEEVSVSIKSIYSCYDTPSAVKMLVQQSLVMSFCLLDLLHRPDKKENYPYTSILKNVFFVLIFYVQVKVFRGFLHHNPYFLFLTTR